MRRNFTAIFRKWFSSSLNLLTCSDNNFISVADPAKIMMDVEDFIGVEKWYTKDNFVINPETGFYCIKQQQKDAELHCLVGGGKVRSKIKLVKNNFIKNWYLYDINYIALKISKIQFLSFREGRKKVWILKRWTS